MFTKRFDRRVYLFVAVLLVASSVGAAFSVYALWPGNSERGYQPEQPIAFRHSRHAGELKIDCRYCHFTVDRSPHAAVPPVSVCMNCHSRVQPKERSSDRINREIAKVIDAWNDRRPILWEHVHILADFVFFDHARHLAAGLECRECHGPVETMDRVARVSALVMKFCLDCHRRPPEKAAQPARAQQAPDDCYTCHR